MQKSILLLAFFSIHFVSYTQKKAVPSKSTLTYDERLYNGMEWRSIGPFRGGRSATATGVAGKPNLFYFGATGGGVWKTTDAGNSWAIFRTAFLAVQLALLL